MFSRSATTRIVALVSGTAVAGLLAASFVASPASADPDPSNPGTPISGVSNPAFLYAGVGADADDSLMQNVALQWNSTVVTASATTPYMESFDATNPQTGAIHENITTKPDCTAIARPNGTGDGFTALTGSTDSTFDSTTPCVDFNRSSSAKTGSQTTLNFWTLGQDAVDWVTVGTSYAPTAPLTISQLQQIFTCQITDWAQVGGQEGAIHLYVNPDSAGTYKFFLSAIGISGGPGAVRTACGSNVPVIEQVDGEAIAGDPQGIAPYSVSKWAGQSNEVANFPDVRGGTVLGHIKDSTDPITTVNQDSTDYNVLNTSFANDGPQGRYLYNVTRDTDTAAEQTLASNLFGPAGYICANENALLIPYGVAPLGTNGSVVCGQED